MSDKPKTVIEEMTSTYEGMRDYQRARTQFEAALLVDLLIDQAGITRAGLSSMLGRGKSFVDQLVDGSNSVSVSTLSDAFHALGYSVRITAVPITLSANPPDVPAGAE